MAVTRIHMLNVRLGDCFIFEREANGHITVIDICCGNQVVEDSSREISLAEISKPAGNYGMCSKPTNPVVYLVSKGMTKVFRFILTHPDMDHMDGIKRLFDTVSVSNFWDCGVRREKPDFPSSQYNEDDWSFYENLISGRIKGVTVLAPRAGSNGKHWNCDDSDGNGEGDYISIVSPSKALVDLANDSGDINDGSYVIIYRSSAGNIIFPGDSN